MRVYSNMYLTLEIQILLRKVVLNGIAYITNDLVEHIKHQNGAKLSTVA